MLILEQHITILGITQVFQLLILERSHRSHGAAHIEESAFQPLAGRHQGPGAQHDPVLDHGAVHHHRPDADQAEIAHRAAMQHHFVAYGHAIPDAQGKSLRVGLAAMGDMQNTAILNIGLLADRDEIDVAPQHAHGPDRYIPPQGHVAHDNGGFIDVHTLTQPGRHVVKYPDCHCYLHLFCLLPEQRERKTGAPCTKIHDTRLHAGTIIHPLQDTSMIVAVFIVLGLVIIAIGYIILIYNRLVNLKHETAKAWSNIDVLLKQRHDELPKLVETCKQYMRHEKETLDAVMRARSSIFSAREQQDLRALGNAEGQLRQGLMQLFAAVEAYPDLKANAAFRSLEARITSLENAISDRREFYNECVNTNNIRLEEFPDLLIARFFGFESFDLLEFNAEETANVDLRDLFGA